MGVIFENSLQAKITAGGRSVKFGRSGRLKGHTLRVYARVTLSRALCGSPNTRTHSDVVYTVARSTLSITAHMRRRYIT